MRAWTVAVGLLVSTDGKLRNVGQHRTARHMDIHVARALAALFSGNEIDLPDVRNEIGVKDSPVILRKVFSFLGEKLFITWIEAVLKHVAVVVNKFRVSKQLESDGLAGEREVTAGVSAAGIEMLVPCVERNRKRAS